jgi:hypothetical protein
VSSTRHLDGMAQKKMETRMIPRLTSIAAAPRMARGGSAATLPSNSPRAGRPIQASTTYAL